MLPLPRGADGESEKVTAVQAGDPFMEKCSWKRAWK